MITINDTNLGVSIPLSDFLAAITKIDMLHPTLTTRRLQKLLAQNASSFIQSKIDQQTSSPKYKALRASDPLESPDLAFQANQPVVM